MWSLGQWPLAPERRFRRERKAKTNPAGVDILRSKKNTVPGRPRLTIWRSLLILGQVKIKTMLREKPRQSQDYPGFRLAKSKRNRGTHAVRDSWTRTCAQEDLGKRNRGTRAGRDSRTGIGAQEDLGANQRTPRRGAPVLLPKPDN